MWRRARSGSDGACGCSIWRCGTAGLVGRPTAEHVGRWGGKLVAYNVIAVQWLCACYEKWGTRPQSVEDADNLADNQSVFTPRLSREELVKYRSILVVVNRWNTLVVVMGEGSLGTESDRPGGE